MRAEREAWRPVLRALIETVLAFDHPDFPAITLEEVEARVLAQFALTEPSGAGLRALLIAFADPAGVADEPRFAELERAHGAVGFVHASLAARRAYLRLWAHSQRADRRRVYTTLKAAVLMPAYGLPALARAVGFDGPRAR